jgi:hypothetical protein
MTPLDSAARRGFWIIFGTALFQLGYPAIYSAAFGTDRRITITAMLFLLLIVFSFVGFVWARALSVILSGFVAAFLFTGFITILSIEPPSGGVNDGFWANLYATIVFPAIGYAACAVLLLMPATTVWQTRQRNRIEQRLIDSRKADAPAVIVESADLQPCPWCGARVLSPTSEECPACKRLA